MIRDTSNNAQTEECLEPQEKDKTFEERWNEFVKNGGTYDESEIDWGKTVGRELI